MSGIYNILLATPGSYFEISASSPTKLTNVPPRRFHKIVSAVVRRFERCTIWSAPKFQCHITVGDVSRFFRWEPRFKEMADLHHAYSKGITKQKWYSKLKQCHRFAFPTSSSVTIFTTCYNNDLSIHCQKYLDKRTIIFLFTSPGITHSHDATCLSIRPRKRAEGVEAKRRELTQLWRLTEVQWWFSTEKILVPTCTLIST